MRLLNIVVETNEKWSRRQLMALFRSVTYPDYCIIKLSIAKPGQVRLPSAIPCYKNKPAQAFDAYYYFDDVDNDSPIKDLEILKAIANEFSTFAEQKLTQNARFDERAVNRTFLSTPNEEFNAIHLRQREKWQHGLFPLYESDKSYYKGKAKSQITASIVCGLISIPVFFFRPEIGIFIAIMAVIFAATALHNWYKAKHSSDHCTITPIPSLG